MFVIECEGLSLKEQEQLRKKIARLRKQKKGTLCYKTYNSEKNMTPSSK